MPEYDVPIYDGSPRTFAELAGSGSEPTPFGIYDSEASFSEAAPKIANYCAYKLGYPIVDIELQDLNFYACFEDAVNIYGAEVNSYNIKSHILELQGASNVGNLTGKSITTSLGRYIDISKMYGSEAGSGGNVDWKHGYIITTASIQEYDLDALWADVSESGEAIEIKTVFHGEPPTRSRYYDPYGGYGTLALMQQFGWEDSYSPAVSFVMYPIYYDVLRMQAIELNRQIRRSGFSFDIKNNKLKIFPIPETEFQVWFDYVVISERDNPLKGESTASTEISDYSDVPYENMVYADINSVGLQWIRD